MEMAEEIGDRSALARSLMGLGFVQMFADPLGSRPTNERACEIARACGDDWAQITATMNLGFARLSRCEFDTGERLFDEVLPLSERHGYLELQAWHWVHKSLRPWAAADIATVSDYTARALGFAQAAGEPTTEALAQGLLAHLELESGSPEAAERRLRAIHARAMAAGGHFALGYTATWLAQAQAALGDVAGAQAALEQVVATGLDWGSALSQATARLADILRVAGDQTAAAVRAREALQIAELIEGPVVVAHAKQILGSLATACGERGRAEALLHEALAMQIDRGLLLWLPQTLDALAEIGAGLESHEEAARTLGIAQRCRDDRNLVRWAPDAPRFADLEQRLRAGLGDHAYELAFAEGRKLSLDEAVIWIRGARGERKRPAHGWESLTPTELRVVALVADGLTNPQIGERMFISRGTVKVHLSHVFAKLGIGSRSELAAEAARRALVS